jgi:transposase InsO family protein
MVDSPRLRRESQTRAAPHAGHGPEGDLPSSADQRASSRNSDLPVFIAESAIERPDQVWSADITYVPLPRGFMYLVAVLDWHSRYVLSWELSNTLDSGFCVAALEAALARQRPEIFNTDQGAQFTCPVGQNDTGVANRRKRRLQKIRLHCSSPIFSVSSIYLKTQNDLDSGYLSGRSGV